jgi:hypothetical protein
MLERVEASKEADIGESEATHTMLKRVNIKN